MSTLPLKWNSLINIASHLLRWSISVSMLSSRVPQAPSARPRLVTTFLGSISRASCRISICVANLYFLNRHRAVPRDDVGRYCRCCASSIFPCPIHPTYHNQVVCTLGPKSRDVPVLEELLRAGMSVARFNFSHGSHEYHQVRPNLWVVCFGDI